MEGVPEKFALAPNPFKASIANFNSCAVQVVKMREACKLFADARKAVDHTATKRHLLALRAKVTVVQRIIGKPPKIAEGSIFAQMLTKILAGLKKLQYRDRLKSTIQCRFSYTE